MEPIRTFTIYDNGVVVLPSEFREKYGWVIGSIIAMHDVKGSLVLSPVLDKEGNITLAPIARYPQSEYHIPPP